MYNDFLDEGRNEKPFAGASSLFPRVGVVVHVNPDHLAGILPLGRHEVEVRLQLVAAGRRARVPRPGRLLVVLRRAVVRRPVGRPVRVVAVLVRRLLRGPGQRVRAGRAVLVMVVRGRWWRAALHVPAAVDRGGRPVQRPGLRVVVTTPAAAAAAAATV